MKLPDWVAPAWWDREVPPEPPADVELTPEQALFWLVIAPHEDAVQRLHWMQELSRKGEWCWQASHEDRMDELQRLRERVLELEARLRRAGAA